MALTSEFNTIHKPCMFVWHPQVALDLRKHHRIVGREVGTKFGQGQQNAELDLPLHLSPFEASLALERGWLETPAAAALLPAERNTVDADSDAAVWKAALVAGKRIRIQLQRTCAAAPPKSYSAAPQASPKQLAQGTGERLARLHTVFRELHGRGFFVTGGHKFGGDFLAYQGDPSCFHAQFCVRVLHSMDGLSDVLLAAANRGAHGAKKHFLLAVVAPLSLKTLAPATVDSDAAGAPLGPAPPAAGLADPNSAHAAIEDAGSVAAAPAATDSIAAAATSERNAGSSVAASPATKGSVLSHGDRNSGSNTPAVMYYCIQAHGQLGPRHDPVFTDSLVNAKYLRAGGAAPEEAPLSRSSSRDSDLM